MIKCIAMSDLTKIVHCKDKISSPSTTVILYGIVENVPSKSTLSGGISGDVGSSSLPHPSFSAPEALVRSFNGHLFTAVEGLLR